MRWTLLGLDGDFIFPLLLLTADESGVASNGEDEKRCQSSHCNNKMEQTIVGESDYATGTPLAGSHRFIVFLNTIHLYML